MEGAVGHAMASALGALATVGEAGSDATSSGREAAGAGAGDSSSAWLAELMDTDAAQTPTCVSFGK